MRPSQTPAGPPEDAGLLPARWRAAPAPETGGGAPTRQAWRRRCGPRRRRRLRRPQEDVPSYAARPPLAPTAQQAHRRAPAAPRPSRARPPPHACPTPTARPVDPRPGDQSPRPLRPQPKANHPVVPQSAPTAVRFPPPPPSATATRPSTPPTRRDRPPPPAGLHAIPPHASPRPCPPPARRPHRPHNGAAYRPPTPGPRPLTSTILQRTELLSKTCLPGAAPHAAAPGPMSPRGHHRWTTGAPCAPRALARRWPGAGPHFDSLAIRLRLRRRWPCDRVPAHGRARPSAPPSILWRRYPEFAR